MAFFGFIIVLLIVLAVLAIIQFNTDITNFSYYFGVNDKPLSYELLARFELGYLANLLILCPLYIHLLFRIRQMKKFATKSKLTARDG